LGQGGTLEQAFAAVGDAHINAASRAFGAAIAQGMSLDAALGSTLGGTATGLKTDPFSMTGMNDGWGSVKAAGNDQAAGKMDQYVDRVVEGVIGNIHAQEVGRHTLEAVAAQIGEVAGAGRVGDLAPDFADFNAQALGVGSFGPGFGPGFGAGFGPGFGAGFGPGLGAGFGPGFGPDLGFFGDEFAQMINDTVDVITENFVPDPSNTVVRQATGSGDNFALNAGKEDEIRGSGIGDTVNLSGAGDVGDSYTMLGGTNTITLSDGNSDSFTVVEVTGTSSGSTTVNFGAGDDVGQAIGFADNTAASAFRPVSFNGGAGLDVLKGGAGADILKGGDGGDIMTGSNGADTFLYGATTEFGDTITDFTAGTDKLKFDISSFSNAFLTTGTNGTASNQTSGGATVSFQNVSNTGDFNTTANNEVIIFSDSSFNSASALQTAIRSGGGTVMTFSNSPDSGIFLAVYGSASNTNIAAIAVSSATTTASATVTDVATLDNVSLNTTDFSFVA